MKCKECEKYYNGKCYVSINGTSVNGENNALACVGFKYRILESYNYDRLIAAYKSLSKIMKLFIEENKEYDKLAKRRKRPQQKGKRNCKTD